MRALLFLGLISLPLSAAITITTADPLPDAAVGEAYSVTFAATGGTAPYTWKFSTPPTLFPQDLTFSSAGVLSGTPTYLSANPAGYGTAYGWSVTVTDALSVTAAKSFHLTLHQKLGVATNYLNGGTVGVAWKSSQTLTTATSSGLAPYTWAVTGGSLPTGLSLNSSTGAITGTPSTTNASPITFTVTDSGGATASGTYNMPVGAAGDGDVEVFHVGPSPVYIDQNGAAVGNAILTTTFFYQGVAGNLYFNSANTTGLPAGVTMTLVCSTGGSGIGDRTCYGPDGLGRYYQYNSGSTYFAVTPIFVFTATGSPAPGTYPMTIDWSAAVGVGGAEKHKIISLNLRVTRLTSPVATNQTFSPPGPLSPYLPVQGLATFTSQMSTLGALWDTIPGGGFCWSVACENGTQAAWYYDGCWNYLRFHDFLHEAPGGPFITFATEAGGVCDAYAQHILSGTESRGFHYFAHGMEKAYQVTGTAEYLNALSWLANSATYSGTGGQVVSWSNSASTITAPDSMVRETSYQLMNYVVAKRNGLAIHAPNTSLPSYALDQRNADSLVLYFYNLFGPSDAQSHCCLNQSFFHGIAARALFDWYGQSGDPRVPVVIKLWLDAMVGANYANVGDASDPRTIGWLPYNSPPPGPGTASQDPCSDGCQQYLSELNNLAASANAWYWWLTGNESYRKAAMVFFNHTFDTDVTFSPKEMNQQFFFGIDSLTYLTTTGGACRMCNSATSKGRAVSK